MIPLGILYIELCDAVFLPSRGTFVKLRGKEHSITLPFSKSPDFLFCVL